MSRSRAGHGVRIIAGKWRGRRLPVADSPGLRPTGDRVREMLFNWLQVHLPGARVLDLFSGSGALGLEAASRGAKEVVLVEKVPRLARHLQHVVAQLPAAPPIRVEQRDALSWLRQGCDRPFDLVFLDPPFAAGLWCEALQALQEYVWLSPRAHVYVEAPFRKPPPVPEGWRLEREKRCGEVLARLLLPATMG